MAGTRSGDEAIVQLKRMKAEKATGEYNLLIRKAFDSHNMIPMTSHEQLSIIPKRLRLSATAEGFQVACCIDGDILARLSFVPPRNPVHSRWSSPLHALVQNPSHDRFRPQRRATYKDALRNSGHAVLTCTRSSSYESGAAAVVPNGRWYTKVGRTTVRRSCWEIWPASRPRPLRCLLKGSNKAPGELRRPLIPMAVVRDSLEKEPDPDA